jgi:hypothetical protein
VSPIERGGECGEQLPIAALGGDPRCGLLERAPRLDTTSTRGDC